MLCPKCNSFLEYSELGIFWYCNNKKCNFTIGDIKNCITCKYRPDWNSGCCSNGKYGVHAKCKWEPKFKTPLYSSFSCTTPWVNFNDGNPGVEYSDGILLIKNCDCWELYE